MNITEIKSDALSEKYYKVKHDSGLTIYVYPKEGYSSTYAIFGTKYGSINNTFKVDSGDTVRVPDGIAHYLEHKLFESEDGDAFSRYAKTGANANAYTSFDKTCYLFSCTDNFEESLEILLDFVQSPYFTKETVQKEQGIIGQEIKMYDDSPAWRVMFNMLMNMYKNHPVRIDIAGTVDSIAQITPEYLYTCYNTYYNLNNMVLCVAGNATVDTVLSIADKMLKKCEPHTIDNIFEDEPDYVMKDYVEQHLPVGMPLFNLGFKEKAGDKRVDEKTLAFTEILLFMLASSTSTLYRELMDKGLINSTFSYEFFEGEGFASTIFSGESHDPEKVADIIKEYIKSLKVNGIDREEFDIAKKATYGDAVASLNSTDNIANMIADFDFSHRELYAYIEAIAKASAQDIENRLSEMLDIEKTTLSVIKNS
ncbi:MAG: insulinase family protein [Ruminococcaceae bacterium]|nr:insulinase family protein [Oscillospiraceae bacterium]